MSNVKKAALEYASERVPDSAKFKEQVIVGNYLREEIHDSFIRGFEFANKWVLVSEKLPDPYQLVIVRNSGKYRLASLQAGDVFVEYSQNSLTNILLDVDEWRLFL